MLASVVTTLVLSAADGGVELGQAVVLAARAQIGVTTGYDPSYRTLPFPLGDVPRSSGVCTDVVIRALRDGAGIDLQERVHRDMRAHFSRYPQRWGLGGADRNIDHRRVLNLHTFFTRRGWSQPLTRDPHDYLPGDLVTCTVPPALPHIMVVSDRTDPHGVPLVIHNIGQGTREEARLFDFQLTGHFRPAHLPFP